MKDKLQKAIYNNNGLYEAIFSGRNITFDRTASIWYSLEKRCFVNKTDEVLGISNFFAPGKDICFWSDTVRFIYDSVARLDIVGYERRDLVGRLRLLGFEPTGNLAVWIKKRSP